MFKSMIKDDLFFRFSASLTLNKPFYLQIPELCCNPNLSPLLSCVINTQL